jgi:hypothetical protein
MHKSIKDKMENSNYDVPSLDAPATTITIREGKADELRIDFIPAFAFGHDDKIEFYVIPDGKGSWMKTNPREIFGQISETDK